MVVSKRQEKDGSSSSEVSLTRRYSLRYPEWDG